MMVSAPDRSATEQNLNKSWHIWWTTTVHLQSQRHQHLFWSRKRYGLCLRLLQCFRLFLFGGLFSLASGRFLGSKENINVIIFSRNKLPKRAFRARLPQLFKEQASKTSISCEASSTFQARSFQSLAPATQNAKMTSHLESLKRQNEHFVRDFLQISHFQLENRRFRASFAYKAIFTELKKYNFCEASATFQDNHQILRLPRYLQQCHVCTSLPVRFVEIAPSPRDKMLRLPQHREKATSQSAAPATKKQRACIDTLPKYCARHAKHENDLTFCDLGTPKRAFRARLPPLFILWKTGWCRSANVPPNGSELTSWRRVGDDDATTTRRRVDDDTTTRQQNKANTGPTPDPNYKREPFATLSGTNSTKKPITNTTNKKH